MRALRRSLLVLACLAAVARGEDAAVPAIGLVAVAERGAEDLDFADDILLPGKRPPARAAPKAGKAAPVASAPVPVSAPEPASRAWLYWAVGLTVLTGGAAWYLHEELEAAPEPARTTEVFTDDPG